VNAASASLASVSRGSASTTCRRASASADTRSCSRRTCRACHATSSANASPSAPAIATVAASKRRIWTRGSARSAAAKACIVGQRSIGSTAIPRSTTACNHAGTRPGVGAWVLRPPSTRSDSSAALVPWNGRSPWSAS
jgi:hypothetical protein